MKFVFNDLIYEPEYSTDLSMYIITVKKNDIIESVLKYDSVEEWSKQVDNIRMLGGY